MITEQISVRLSARTLRGVAGLLLAALPLPAQAQRAAAGQAPRITEQQSGVTQLIQAVHATSANVVWASGPGGVVLRTIDGGSTWQRRTTPAGDSLQFRDVHALNADTAWVLSIGNGPASRIYRTVDGGTTWALQFINRDSAAFYDCMSFGTRDQGIVFSDATADGTHILRTTNGGATWSLLSRDVVPTALPSEGRSPRADCVSRTPTRARCTSPPGLRERASSRAPMPARIGRPWKHRSYAAKWPA